MGLQTHPRTGFLDLPMKTSLWGWHGTWFYCENHEPSHPPFVGRLPEFQGSWSEEPTPLERVRPYWSLRGRPLASPQSHSSEKTCSPGLGVQWTPRPDSGNQRQDYPGAFGETPRRNVSRHLQLADWRVGALLPYQGGKGLGKASWLIQLFMSS
jgi:hypothetical protein